MVVLNVSMGMSRMRNKAAPTDASTVLAATGRFSVDSKASRAASTPVLAAVSPKRLRGPCRRAGMRPL
jgi:hypothetical protein